MGTTAQPGERLATSGILVALLLWASAATVARAQILSLDVSSDTDWTASATTVRDHEVRRISFPSGVPAVALGPLPAAVDVSAVHALDDGRLLFALSTSVDLGSGPIRPRDVVAWDGATYSPFFDGAAAGIPDGVRVDALGVRRQGGGHLLLLSFDVDVLLPGGLAAADEDLVAWEGFSAGQPVWSLDFDGSASGVSAALDVDGFDSDPVTGERFFSFDASGEIGGVRFEDDDVVALLGNLWSLAWDASASLAGTFPAGDLDALGVRTNHIFQDDFETGATGRWSTTVP